MLCAIYRSSKRESVYLYIEKRDYFAKVPEELLNSLGNMHFVMLFNLKGPKSLRQADNLNVLTEIIKNGFYLQIPQIECAFSNNG